MISGGNGADTLDHRDYSELKLVDRRVWYFVGWHQRNPHSVRHAQGLHNLSHANHHLPDPGLTPLGEDQARSLACSFLGADKIGTIELVLASPLRRTIQTALALLASPPCMPAAVDGSGGSIQRVVAWPEVQEASHLPCDTGSPLDEIRAQFAHAPVDFAMVESGWHVKVSVCPTPEQLYVHKMDHGPSHSKHTQVELSPVIISFLQATREMDTHGRNASRKRQEGAKVAEAQTREEHFSRFPWLLFAFPHRRLGGRCQFSR